MCVVFISIYIYVSRRHILLAPKNSCIHLSLVPIHHIPFSTFLCDCLSLSNGAFHISRPYTFLGDKKSFCFHISSSLAMADFDAQQAQAHRNQFEQDQARIAFL